MARSDCSGLGTKVVRRTVYRWPMLAAMDCLAREAPVRPTLAAPATIVIATAAAGWSWTAAVRRLGMAHEPDAEAIVLYSFRRLRHYYHDEPPERWTVTYGRAASIVTPGTST
jgi:hypothetical protein